MNEKQLLHGKHYSAFNKALLTPEQQKDVKKWIEHAQAQLKNKSCRDGKCSNRKAK